jgi:uncharacterized membrane protein
MEIIDIIKLSIIVLLLDSIYLSSLSFWFNDVVNSIQKSNIDLDYISAGLCYILIIFTLKYFAVNKNFTYIETFLLGFSIYGIFELTNKAIFKKWDWISVLIDTTWGGCLYLFSLIIFNNLKIF